MYRWLQNKNRLSLSKVMGSDILEGIALRRSMSVFRDLYLQKIPTAVDQL